MINIASFSHLLKRVHFNAIVDHLALTHIIKSKAGPETTRIKSLLELISSYSFNLYYIKGKDMILGDFLSKQTHDSDPQNIILISSNMHETLYENYYRIETKERYFIQTQLQTKSSGIALPEVHGAKKLLDMNISLGKQKIAPQNKKIVENKPRLGQGRAGIRCKKNPTC